MRPAAKEKKRCRLHGGAPRSGAPKGDGNGNYRSGRFTCEAVEERKALRNFIRAARGALGSLAGRCK
ncbi:hypothetical protein [Methylocapsa palsarum]|uniref:hypothetical protein n=1 Tax=Methylocapsa palsarum TaxID=1612308 RepID=UPI00244E7F50|nr:hypothetical protein [Methylocapsa palsarum]